MEHVDPAARKRFENTPCEFCREVDPHFSQRRPMDQLVVPNRESVASAHLTEDGYVRHRIFELNRITARMSPRAA